MQKSQEHVEMTWPNSVLKKMYKQREDIRGSERAQKSEGDTRLIRYIIHYPHKTGWLPRAPSGHYKSVSLSLSLSLSLTHTRKHTSNNKCTHKPHSLETSAVASDTWISCV